VLARGERNGVVRDQEITMLEAKLVVLVVPAVNQQHQMALSIKSSRKNQVLSVADLVRGTFLSMD
jgi:hypothetical protein